MSLLLLLNMMKTKTATMLTLTFMKLTVVLAVCRRVEVEHVQPVVGHLERPAVVHQTVAALQSSVVAQRAAVQVGHPL